MCIVIDTNVLSRVFSTRDSSHTDFVPVREWIVNGPGCAVYGGTAYLNELRKASAYLGIMSELRRKGRAKLVKTDVVDAEQAAVAALTPSPCNDTHLIAIFRASGCRLLCSNDRRCDTYIKDKRYYHSRQCIPRIYRNRSHSISSVGATS